MATTGKCFTESDRDNLTLDIKVYDIEWPEGTNLPKEVYIVDVDIPEDEDKTLGDVINDKLIKWFDVEPVSFHWEDTNPDDDDEDEEDSPADFLEDLIDAVSKETISGRVFSVMGVLADHGLIPTDEETPTDEEEEDDDCECDGDCDNCPCNDENSTENEEDKEVSDDEYIKMCADFLNGLVNLVMESRKESSKDTDK